MPLISSPLLWSARVMAALGLSALTLTGEIGTGYLAVSWSFWILSVLADHFPNSQQKFRRYETPAVIFLAVASLFDFLVKRNTIFVSLSHFLLLFQIIKLVGRKTRVDTLQISLFGFFQILAACTLSVNVWHAGVLLLLIPTATMVLFWNYLERESEKGHQLIPMAARRPLHRLTWWMCLSALPMNLALTAGVFILFPRLSLNVSMPGLDSERSGYIDQVNLAQTGNLSNDNSTVLWLAFPSADDRLKWDGYLRGTTLDFFDGKRWSSSKTDRSRPFLADSNGVFTLDRPGPDFKPLRQMITLMNTSGSTLFATGLPIQVVAPLQILQREMSGCLHWNSNWRRPLRYQVLSDIGTSFNRRSLDITPLSSPYEKYLELPSIPLQRIQALTRRITGKSSGTAAALAIENYLRTHLRYSTELGTRDAFNPVDDFLFIRQRGPCGSFASAMALMLRLNGIPSRVAAGYYKGEWNDPAEQVLIRERDAHAWVEAFITGKGWVTFDPTPRDTTTGTGDSHTWRSVQQYLDYLGFKWDKWVVEYDLYTQIKAFENLRDTSEKVNTRIAEWWARLPKVKTQPFRELKRPRYIPLFYGGFILPLFFGFFAIRNRSASFAEGTAIRQYRRLLKELAQKGMPKESTETGWEFAGRVVTRWPNEAFRVMPVTHDYYQARFAPSERKGNRL